MAADVLGPTLSGIGDLTRPVAIAADKVTSNLATNIAVLDYLTHLNLANSSEYRRAKHYATQGISDVKLKQK